MKENFSQQGKKKSQNFDASSVLFQAMLLLIVSHTDFIVQTLSVINLLDRVTWLKYSNRQMVLLRFSNWLIKHSFLLPKSYMILI